MGYHNASRGGLVICPFLIHAAVIFLSDSIAIVIIHALTTVCLGQRLKTEFMRKVYSLEAGHESRLESTRFGGRRALV